MWDIHREEQNYIEAFSDWDVFEFDTHAVSLDAVVDEVCQARGIVASKASIAPALGQQVYTAMDSRDDRLREIEVSGHQVRLLGTWLDLLPRQDGSMRIAHSNSLLRLAGTRAELESDRFGKVSFQRAGQ